MVSTSQIMSQHMVTTSENNPLTSISVSQIEHAYQIPLVNVSELSMT